MYTYRCVELKSFAISVMNVQNTFYDNNTASTDDREGRRENAALVRRLFCVCVVVVFASVCAICTGENEEPPSVV